VKPDRTLIVKPSVVKSQYSWCHLFLKIKKMSRKRNSPTSKKVSDETKDLEIDINSWYSDITSPKRIDKLDLKMIYDTIKYKGFSRANTLKSLRELVGNDVDLMNEIILVCSLRGPQQAAITTLTNGMRLVDMGVPASGVQGTDKLSCGRIGAATADVAAYMLKKLNVPKRIENHELPGWLQFPQAGSIKLPHKYREMHIDFSKKFSIIIGGVFNEQIYNTMVNNAYLKEDLKLFTMEV